MLHRIPHLIPIPAMQCITREQCTEYGLILKFIKKREGHNSAFREKRIKRYRIYSTGWRHVSGTLQRKYAALREGKMAG